MEIRVGLTECMGPFSICMQYYQLALLHIKRLLCMEGDIEQMCFSCFNQ